MIDYAQPIHNHRSAHPRRHTRGRDQRNVRSIRRFAERHEIGRARSAWNRTGDIDKRLRQLADRDGGDGSIG